MQALQLPKKLMGYLLTDFIHSFPEIAHFKESQSFTYQVSNQSNLNVYNLQEEKEIIGKTVFDLNDTIMKGKWPPNFAEEIHQSDLLVVKNKTPIKLDHKVFLNQSGYLVVHSMIKLPVFDKNKEILGILTLSFDSTKSEEALKIKKIYNQFYDLTESNKRFMEHFDFKEGVKLKLSPREMDCILAISKCRTNKAASHYLNISVKTLDNHLQNIKDKTGGHYSIYDLVDNFSKKVNRI